MRHDFDDGKYTVIFDEKTGKMEALRHGEPWQDLCGNNLVYFMLSAYDSTRLETAQLQARVAELEVELREAYDDIGKLQSELSDADQQIDELADDLESGL